MCIMCVCVCVCVCARACKCVRERERETERESSAPSVGSGIPVHLDPYRYTVPRQPVSVHSVLPSRTASPIHHPSNVIPASDNPAMFHPDSAVWVLM